MSNQALMVIKRLWDVLTPEDVVAGMADEALNARVRAMLVEIAEPDFVVKMHAPAELGGTTFEGRGADGFRRVWEQWVEPFSAFRIELDDRIQSGDHVVDLVMMAATSKTGGVEVEHAGAAVWTVRNGRLASATFYLERNDALEAAGIDPDRLRE